MALEPAGVSLQAENFNKYIKQLDTIDKTQQDIFDVSSSSLTKAFNDATKAADRYENELKKIDSASKKAGKSQQNLDKSLEASSGGFKSAAAGIAAFVTGAAVQFAAESAQLAAQLKGQQQAVSNLAATYGQSGNEIRAAISRAAQGTLNQSEVASAALTGLQFEVATTAEQFERASAAAAVLGRARGIGAAEGIARLFEGIGKRELELLDELGISTRNVNIEMDRLAKQQFNATAASLTQIQRETLFVEAALTIAEQKAAAIGGGADTANLAFERLAATSQNLQVTFGTLAGPLAAGIADGLNKAAVAAQQLIAILGAGFTSIGAISSGVFSNIFASFRGESTQSIDDILDEAREIAVNRFKEIASTIEGVSFPEEGIKRQTQAIESQSMAIESATQNLDAYQNSIKQAEQLQLSFARAAEDSALKIARANEDIARKQAKEQAKLLDRQIKELDEFNKNSNKEIEKTRKEADETRKRDQRKLQRDLLREQERFNLSRLQSERRFAVSERRLIAEGDILGLQQLREDQELSRQEEKENFDQSQNNRVSDAEETQREQAQDLEKQLATLTTNLEDQRAELLQSFDEQLALQQQKNAEDAAERAIALQREEEDRRISQARQLEDLGRSFAEQEGITAEGTQAIAGELEKVFGQSGVADSIFAGFSARTKSDFKDLFAELEKTASSARLPIPLPRDAGGRRRIGGVPEFNEGGIVPGPVGSPQLIQAHGGETVLPTHQGSFQRQSFTMAAPVIPSQNLDVTMAGGFNITGGEQASETVVQAALTEMTENFTIAVRRLARRN